MFPCPLNLLQAIYLFGFGIPLFIDSNDHTHQMKWNLWVVHRLVLTAVYGFILFMYHSKWRERLPGKFVWHMQIKVVSYQFHCCLISLLFFFFQYSAARPAFYNYIVIMFSMNALALFACALTGNGASFGFW
jgi:hypothetical protein